MQKKIIRDKANLKFHSIENQLRVVNGFENKIPEIELDILLEKIRDFYQDITLLVKVSENEILDVAKPNEAPMYFQEHQPEENAQQPTLVEKKFTENAFKENIMEKTETTPVANNEEERTNTVSLFPDLEIPATKDKIEPVAPELFDTSPLQRNISTSDTPVSLYDNLIKNQQKDMRFVEQMEQKKIVNLKNAIGINDKFIIMNELFEGNMKEYDEAINKLNNFATFEQAADYLNQLQFDKTWNENLPSLAKLNSFVSRRFIK